jgi:tetratricopeptide (TPR) repeat protein
LIAQLGDVINGAPRDQAALQLAALAEQYKRRSRWQLAEDTLIELVQRYPREPVALEAMQWLLALWTSQEMGWQRLATMTIDRSQLTINAGVTQSTVTQAQQLLPQEGGASRIQELARSMNSPLTILPLGGQIEYNGEGGQRRSEASRWWEQALRLASTIERTDPEFYRDPQVQFVCAALLRNRGQYQQSDEIYRRYTNDSDRLWQRTARGEMWVLGGATQSPKPVVRCHRVDAPPVLDGLLSDICWQDAMEIRLLPDDGSDAGQPDQFIETQGFTADSKAASDRTAGDEPRALAMLACDAKYLYFAASVPRSAGLPDDRPVYPGRTHDADLSGHDQVSLLLDVDRDYATYYRFDIDSRAQTREACWVDQKWDPTWYVACDSDPRRWTVEAAIPMQAIVPAPPGKGQIWAAGVVRTMPADGVQSWTHPTGSAPRPVTFGLVRFD